MTGRLPWLKLWTEARNDAKLRSLSDSQFRAWFNLLCYAADESDRGAITENDMDILAVEVAGGDTDLLLATLDRLTRLRIISRDGDTITFLHFEERQQRKPSDEPEAVAVRVARHRAAKRNAPSLEVPANVTPRIALQGVGNAPVTPQEEEVEEEVEEDRDLDRVKAAVEIAREPVQLAKRSAAVTADEQAVLSTLQRLRGWPTNKDPAFDLRKVREWLPLYGKRTILELASQMDTWLAEEHGEEASPRRMGNWLQRNVNKEHGSNGNHSGRSQAHHSGSGESARPDSNVGWSIYDTPIDDSPLPDVPRTRVGQQAAPEPGRNGAHLQGGSLPRVR